MPLSRRKLLHIGSGAISSGFIGHCEAGFVGHGEGKFSVPNMVSQYVSQLAFVDDFIDTSTIDANNTLDPKFNWFVTRIPSFQGTSLANSPTLSNQYSVANSILTITSNPGPEPEAAWQFQ